MIPTKLLSIDPSIANIGYALFEDGDLKEYGTVKSEAEKGNIPDRLKFILSQFNRFEGISHVVIESPPHFTYSRSDNNGKPLNLKSMNKLHMAIGAIIAYFSIKNIPVEMVNPNEWNKNRQSKQVTKNNVKYIHGINVNEHVADAIMIGEHCNYLLRIRRMEAFGV
jgi:Holliday junction resolvasome RuvABC endonuclease subunit